MPRASAPAKRQQGASSTNRDTRHENGLVGPAKRTPKQQQPSQQQQQQHQQQPPPTQQQQFNQYSHYSQQSPSPNGALRLPADDAAPLPPTTVPSTPPNANGYSKIPLADMAPDHRNMESLRRSSVGAYSESSSSESYNSHVNGLSQECHRRIDVNATNNSNVHRDPGPLDFALTVLRSCPLQDTIAILIILMQIPPIALSGIYVLFTLLTFVTASNGLTFNDVFEWNLGAPSLATVICVDGIVLLIWLFLWGPVQHVILDLAQMVIALGLGGGSSSRDGGSMKNTLICLSMIVLSHVLRHSRMKYSPVGYLLGSSRFMVPDIDDPFESIESLRGYDKVRSGWFGWARSILAIHILTQGLVKYIRDWYLRRERRDDLAKGADPEAGKSCNADHDGGFSTPDSDAASLQNTSALTTKKKRKQSAQIRNKQPLWAALASTKIVVVKEYELTHAASESAGSNATDIHNLGNAPFNAEPEQIWISYVGCDEVCFNTSYFPAQPLQDEPEDDCRFDLTKPFYVRVNNAVWQPTRMTPVENPEDDYGQGVKWSGDIYGLTPVSNYECEFISTATQEVIFSTSVRTTQAKFAVVDTGSTKPSNQRSLRPDSPTTTLKTSIAAAEAKLAEEKARQKTSRKEYHRKTNAMKKENEKLSTAVQSAGTGDDKLRQKIQQNSTQQKQAEQAIQALEAELKDFESIPESLRSAWKAKQSAWNNEKAKYDGAIAAFKSFQSSVDNSTKTLDEEKASLQARRNKLTTRIAKVEGEYARIADANARGLDEAERRRQARETYQNDIAGVESDLVRRIQDNESRIQHQEQENMSLKAELDSFHSQQQAAYAYAASYEFPDPANHFSPATSAAQLHAAPPPNGPFEQGASWNNGPYKPSMWGPSPLAPAFTPQSSSITPARPATKSRGRSSSMLSDVSGFTQDSGNGEERKNGARGAEQRHPGSRPTGSGDYGFHPFPYQSPQYGEYELGSDGSGSGGDGSVGSGSLRDPTSPSP